MAPANKGEEKRDRSAINNVVTRDYPISIHKFIHEVGFKKHALWALKEIWKFTMKEMETPDVSRTPSSISSLGHRNKECLIPYLGAVVQKT